MNSRFFSLFILLVFLFIPVRGNSSGGDSLRLADKVYSFYTAGQTDSIYSLGRSYLNRYGMSRSDFAGQVDGLRTVFGSVVSAEPWTVTGGAGYSSFYRQLRFRRFSATMITTFDSHDSLTAFAIINVKTLKADNERQLTIETDGLKLPALLSLPSNRKGRVPVVVLVHGSGPCDMNEMTGLNFPFLDLADGLSAHGIAVLRYDKRTKVYPSKWIPQGKEGNYDTETVDDAISAVSMVSRLPEIDSTRIVVVGHSLGAALAPRIASRSPLVSAIVLMAPHARKLPTILREQLDYLLSDSVQVENQFATICRGLPKTYLQFDETYSPVSTASRLHIPILLLQGGRDYQVTSADYQLWLRGMKNRSTFSHISYPALNHLFVSGKGKSTPQDYNQPGHVDQQVVADIASWIANHFSRISR